MKKIKTMTIFGTRPEAIKMAPLIKTFEKNEHIENIVCVTAQHREMLDQVLEIFDIKPHFDLDIMKDRQTLSHILTKALLGIQEVLLENKPDIILVHGDTSTTFAGALAAFYNQIPIGHVEAGLRTYDKFQPFPEEINRTLTTSLADLHFAPTSSSKSNLLKENVLEKNIFITGNTVIDALNTTIKDSYTFDVDALNDIDYNANRVIVVTAHRRENLGEPLENICNAIKEIVLEFPDVIVLYAVHKNPVVVETVNNILGNLDNVLLLDPLNINDMHNLLNKSFLVLTDSGGLQEEVPSMGKPVLVLRNVTERPEGIDAGTLKLVGNDKNNIYNETKLLLTNKEAYQKMAKAKNPFGDGNASKRITEAILYHFEITNEKPIDF